MKRAPSLRALQQWLALVMRHPVAADAAVRSRPARALFPLRAVLGGEVVKPNARMSVTERLDVYNDGYLVRLHDVLASDFGGLQQLLGAERFRRLCRDYVARHPSRHPNLNQLSLHLPAFVARQRDLSHHAFATELAAFELHLCAAFDAPACTPLPEARLRSVAEADWAHARLTCNPSLRLQACRFPTNAWYKAWKQDQSPRPPRRKATHVAIFRQDWRVFRMDLQPAAFAVLSALRRGRPLLEALQHADGDAAVGTWFASWTADGLFTDVRVRRRAAPPHRRRAGAGARR